jgi:dihydroorotate dehydrogenase
LLLNASGCLDALTAPDVARSLDAFVTKTVTPEPRRGNEPVRIAETDHGMLNSIGLQNPGRERFLRDVLPRLRQVGVPIWVSVGGFSARDYAETGVDAISIGALTHSAPWLDLGLDVVDVWDAAPTGSDGAAVPGAAAGSDAAEG